MAEWRKQANCGYFQSERAEDQSGIFDRSIHSGRCRSFSHRRRTQPTFLGAVRASGKQVTATSRGVLFDASPSDSQATNTLYGKVQESGASAELVALPVTHTQNHFSFRICGFQCEKLWSRMHVRRSPCRSLMSHSTRQTSSVIVVVSNLGSFTNRSNLKRTLLLCFFVCNIGQLMYGRIGVIEINSHSLALIFTHEGVRLLRFIVGHPGLWFPPGVEEHFTLAVLKRASLLSTYFSPLLFRRVAVLNATYARNSELVFSGFGRTGNMQCQPGQCAVALQQGCQAHCCSRAK